MGTLQDSHCAGCVVCPSVASSDPTHLPARYDADGAETKASDKPDSINFTVKVNCLKSEWAAKRSSQKPSEQNSKPWDTLHNWYDSTYGSPQRRATALERAREEMQKQRMDAELSRIDAEAWRLCQQVPRLEPIWLQFMRSTGRERTPEVARCALQLTQQLLGLFSPEAARAEMVRTHKELIDLCERVVKAWDAADDKMEMQDAIEELDSLLYDLDKREGLSGS
jgi:ferredoxin